MPRDLVFQGPLCLSLIPGYQDHSWTTLEVQPRRNLREIFTNGHIGFLQKWMGRFFCGNLRPKENVGLKGLLTHHVCLKNTLIRHYFLRGVPLNSNDHIHPKINRCWLLLGTNSESIYNLVLWRSKRHLIWKWTYILLMEEIRRSPVEVGSLSHYLQGFVNPRWLPGFLPSTVILNNQCVWKEFPSLFLTETRIWKRDCIMLMVLLVGKPVWVIIRSILW